MYGLVTTTGPTEEPITLALAKSHLRIDHDDEDTLITSWIAAAREMTETHCSKRWVEQEVRLTLSGWPCDGLIRLPVEPVSAVESVKYLDTDGTLQTIAEADYQTALDFSPPLIAPQPGEFWPVSQSGGLAPVRVEFTAGYGGAADVPPMVAAAMLLCLSYWDENRGGEPSHNPSSLGMPAGARSLLSLLWSGNY